MFQSKDNFEEVENATPKTFEMIVKREEDPEVVDTKIKVKAKPET